MRFLGVKAQVQLAVHLDKVAKIINRTLASFDLKPSRSSVTDDDFETVHNLLGILTDNGQLIHQIINRRKQVLYASLYRFINNNIFYILLILGGKIVNQVMGSSGDILSSTVVGNYQQNMTFTGVFKRLDNGYVIKQYSYPSPSDSSTSANILINIVFDALGNVLKTNVINPSSTTINSTSGQNVGK